MGEAGRAATPDWDRMRVSDRLLDLGSGVGEGISTYGGAHST